MTGHDTIPRKKHKTFSLVLLLLGALSGALSVARYLFPVGTFSLIVYYLCQLLTLFIGFLGLGAGFFFLAHRAYRTAARYPALAGAGLFLSLLIAGVTESFNYIDYGFGDALVIQIGAAIINTGIYMLLYYAILLIAYLLFFRNVPKKHGAIAFFHGRIAAAGALMAGILLLTKLPGEIADTLDFVDVYWPNIASSEIAMMVFDYIFLALSLFLGYLSCSLAAMYFAASEETE